MADTGDAANASVVHNRHAILILWRNGQEKKKRYDNMERIRSGCRSMCIVVNGFLEKNAYLKFNDDFGCRVCGKTYRVFTVAELLSYCILVLDNLEKIVTLLSTGVLARVLH